MGISSAGQTRLGLDDFFELQESILINLKKLLITLLHALAVWVLCGATIFAGRALFTMETTLVIHAIGAPILASVVSLFYYKKFNFMSPAGTALTFFLLVVAIDAGFVAPVLEKSYVMFTDPLGTWIPMVLVALATHITGVIANRKTSNTRSASRRMS